MEIIVSKLPQALTINFQMWSCWVEHFSGSWYMLPRVYELLMIYIPVDILWESSFLCILPVISGLIVDLIAANITSQKRYLFFVFFFTY